MNIYYAPPAQIHGTAAELLDQEARHASKVMRAREGDQLVIVDGKGGRYEGPIRRITKQSVQIEIQESQYFDKPQPELLLGMGIIKKRDRLEFAVEKAVELGAAHIALFRSRRTIKENVRMDRLESITLSAMKQSLRTWRPEVTLFHSIEEVIASFPEAQCVLAHEKVSPSKMSFAHLAEGKDQPILLMVGPEGGFADAEVDKMVDAGAELASLGSHRLRAETAVVALMSQFLS
ncbi:RsmE family RNA methyltransferase [Fodinibius salsisoli]|uniref:Ribosomal RNA small subunit methyltransferase E n=1 Tax=Fodinibius salsisoli TaxID=2820877 RepID=A0ABT3PIU0_9BACT|nr:RsmE family RNA methyltransferase [Fodinibius salsisoli]MCW9705836.1 16S rRNA (uracil(1498)-N(3))-methyltransferase [Fodinibius salsisoli]